YRAPAWAQTAGSPNGRASLRAARRDRLRLVGGRAIGAKAPDVALWIAGRIVARAVIGIVELGDDLGTRGPRALVVRVGVVDRHVDRCLTDASGVDVVLNGAEHQNAGTIAELGMGNRAILVGVDHALAEPEG